MEVMARPSKELLIFLQQIDEWVDEIYPDKDTPQSILNLFDSIK